MTLSLLLLIILALFLIPCFLLSKNRLQFYLFCSFPSALVLVALFALDFSFPSFQINEKIGEFFLPLWHWLLKGYAELKEVEIIHLSTSFSYFLLYFICYLICYIPMRFLYIGSNPDIHKPIKTITRVINIILFLLTTYGVFFIFFINMRQILPFPDGFLSFLFDWFYTIEV